MLDFDTPYLTNQIIAYIGNKRKLLGLIYQAMQELNIDIKPGLKFFDVFAGSGVVSRFAKTLNFEVFSNDWEYYSKVINTAFLSINKKDLKKMFGSEENFIKLLSTINSLPDPNEKEQFISKYYAPKEHNIESVDFKTERLFYTRQNALIIDKIRNYIEQEFPKTTKDKNTQKIHTLLTALIIYEAATHNNTSGVFKAFHKEFGGHGKDALKRITTQIQLQQPVLIDSDFQSHVFQEDANKLVKMLKNIDVAYLDPPYNQHQYGSNYFMLNTIAKWDGVAIPLTLDNKGVLKEKAGIRHDWINTRSSYCYKDEAEKSFKDLILNLDAKYILISYSTDGIIPFEQMCEICMKKGRVSIVTNEYTTYRGGKQSNNRQNTDIEFILCIDSSQKSDKKTIAEIQTILSKKKLSILFKQKYSKTKLQESGFELKNDSIGIKIGQKVITIQTDNYFSFHEPSSIYTLSNKDTDKLYSVLYPCICNTKEEELNELIGIAKQNCLCNKKLLKAIPHTLKKLASKKNKELFFECLEKIEQLKIINLNAYIFISDEILKVKSIAEKRFTS